MNKPQIIPKIIHRVWFGPKPLPESTISFLEKQFVICANYDHRLWNEENTSTLFPFMLNGSAVMLQDARPNSVIKSDILRYELLRLFGGIYLDTDIEMMRTFDELLDAPFFCADEGMDNIGTAVLGSIPYHPLNNAMLTAIYGNYIKSGIPKNPNEQMSFGGPWLFTKTSKLFNIEVLPRKVLYPFHNPRLPATVHYFNGGESTNGWINKINRGKNDTAHSAPDLARMRPDTGAVSVFHGRNRQVLQGK